MRPCFRKLGRDIGRRRHSKMYVQKRDVEPEVPYKSLHLAEITCDPDVAKPHQAKPCNGLLGENGVIFDVQKRFPVEYSAGGHCTVIQARPAA